MDMGDWIFFYIFFLMFHVFWNDGPQYVKSGKEVPGGHTSIAITHEGHRSKIKLKEK